MSLKSTKLNTDSARVTTDFYEKPLWGSFIDMAKSREVDDKGYSYPQFVSFSKNIIKKDILEGIDYVGGFALMVRVLLEFGLNNEPANLIFYNKDKAL